MTIESWVASAIVFIPVAAVLALAAVVTFGSKPASYWPALQIPPQQTMDKAEFDRGHNWAASVIRTDGEGAVEMLEEFVEAEREFGRFSDFDRGVRQAISEWEQEQK